MTGVQTCALPILIGAGLGGTYMPGLKSLTDHLQGAAQSRATAFYTAAFGVGSSISIVVSGKIAAAFGWPAAFAFGAIGPVLAALLVIVCMPKGRVHAAHESAAAPALLDFRPVLKNRTTRLFVLGYSLHNYELFGQRSWMVAFLVFCGSLQPEGAGLPLAAATLAAMINVLGPVMSVSGNELALRYGRARIMTIGAAGSGLLSLVFGFAAGLPWLGLLVFAVVHMYFIGIDAGALTSGVVTAAEPEHRGSTIDRKSTRLNSSHSQQSRMPSSA